LQKTVKPSFDKLTDESKAQVKNSMRYFLTTRKLDFYNILINQQESSLRLPDDPIGFFVSLWEILFPGESYELSDTIGWAVEEDTKGLRFKE